MRTWKQYYTVLSGPELCFYKDRKDFQQVKYKHVYLFNVMFSLHTSVKIKLLLCVFNFPQQNYRFFGSIFSIELCNFTRFTP